MKKSLLVLLTAVLLSACANKPDETGNGTSTEANVTLNFKAKVNTADFACGNNYTGVGAGGTHTLVARDFRFYVHDIRLVKADNSEVSLTLQANTWQRDGVVLLDFENATGDCASTGAPTAAMNGQAVGTIPRSAGESFTRIRFVLGVPQSLNHLDVTTVQPPLNYSSLYWNWTAGYKFARLDFRTTAGHYSTNNFNIHPGSTGCSGTPPAITCTATNRPQVELEIPTANRTSLAALANMQLVADVAQLVRDIDLAQTDQGGPQGCMAGTTDPECRHVMTRLGVSYTYTGTTNAIRDATNGQTYTPQGGGHSSQVSAQSFFRAE